jgi:hypothetical protein
MSKWNDLNFILKNFPKFALKKYFKYFKNTWTEEIYM